MMNTPKAFVADATVEVDGAVVAAVEDSGGLLLQPKAVRARNAAAERNAMRRFGGVLVIEKTFSRKSVKQATVRPSSV